MDLILHNGKKLYQKELIHSTEYSDIVNNIEKVSGVRVYEYQKELLKRLNNQNKPEFNIFGDDFKIEIIPVNVRKYCAVTIRDYDEKQEFENEIAIDLTKDELSSLINLLETVKENMI